MKKRILALLLTLALVLPAVSCDVLLADPNGPATPVDSQSQSNTPKDTEKAPVSVTPETKPQTPPDDEPEDSEPNRDPDEAQTEYIEPETEYVLEEYTVHFILEGYGEQPEVQTVTEGKFAKEPKVSIDPAVGTFEGAWYTEPIYDTPYKFDFNTPITGDITLYGYVIPNPAAPVGLIGAEQLAELASADGEYGPCDIGSADVLTQGTHSFVRLTGGGSGDPWFMVARDCGKMPDYMVIRYRTNSSLMGQFFLGSGNGPNGQGDNFQINWNANNEWNLAIIHLPTCGATSIENGVINYLRFDPFAGYHEGDYIDIAYIAFFNSPEYAEAYDFEHYPPYVEKEAAGMITHSIDTFYVNGKMYFEQDGGAGDKLTAQNNTVTFTTAETHDSMMLRGWIGFDQPFVNFGYYVDDYEMIYNADFTRPTEEPVKMAGGEHASRFEITVPLANLKGGTHFVGFVVKLEDGTVVRLREEIKVVIVPNHIDETLILGVRDGGPFTGGAEKRFGQRSQIGENFLKNVTINDLASYADGNTNTWSFKVWQWKGDYATTVAADPLYEHFGSNHLDNSTFSLDIPAALMISGDIYYELEYLSGSGCFTGWTAKDVVPGLETYVNGQLRDQTYASSFVIGNTHYANFNVPQDQWVITGHRPQLQNSSDGMVAAAGVEYAALLHQGSICLGSIDLSKYDKVVVYYGIDKSDITWDFYYNNPNNRIMLTTCDTNMLNSPIEDTIIAEATYEPSGWAVTAFEIDLTGDYSGPVYITWDTLPGTFMLISSVEFIGGEIE